MTDQRRKTCPPVPFSLRIYSTITLCLTPLLHLAKPLLSLYGGFRDTVPERLGRFSPVLDDLARKRDADKSRGVVWIHAVSVGEAAIAKVLVESIRERSPDALIAISTTTFTGRDYILKNFEPDALFFFPLDLPHVMRNLVRKLKPSCFLDIEIELWPNMIRALCDEGVPIALANGRISDRSRKIPRGARSIYRWVLGSFDRLFMRSEQDVERIIGIGAPAESTKLAGNLKFAACGCPPSDSERESVRSILGLTPESVLLVAGSTHPGEDEQIIDAYHHIVKKGLPDKHRPLHLVIAPRHLEQVDRIGDLMVNAGLNPVLWTEISNGSTRNPESRGVVVNTIGELMKLYGAADLAFVGGSLIERGGHNVLEPVAMGVPTLHGPSMANFHDLQIALGDAGLLYEVKNADEFATSALSILESVDRSDYTKRARKLIDSQMMASSMIAEWVTANLT